MAIKATKSSLDVTRTMVWTLLIAYSLFLVGRSTYNNYKIKKDIEREKVAVQEEVQKKKTLELLLVYYKSAAYQEIEARRRLGLKGKDEHMVALPFATTEPQFFVASAKKRQADAPAPPKPYQAWWQLFFGAE